jgi:hypothetical protein
LPGNISAGDITVALLDIDYDIISLKQMTVKRSTPEGGVLVTLANNQKALKFFKFILLCDIVIKIEV